MLPDMPEFRVSTLDLAPLSEHGAALEQVLPLPLGEAYRVVVPLADAIGPTI
jgi:hypothetical protein